MKLQQLDTGNPKCAAERFDGIDRPAVEKYGEPGQQALLASG
jgi:hypothetical protein